MHRRPQKQSCPSLTVACVEGLRSETSWRCRATRRAGSWFMVDQLCMLDRVHCVSRGSICVASGLADSCTRRPQTGPPYPSVACISSQELAKAEASGDPEKVKQAQVKMPQSLHVRMHPAFSLPRTSWSPHTYKPVECFLSLGSAAAHQSTSSYSAAHQSTSSYSAP